MRRKPSNGLTAPPRYQAGINSCSVPGVYTRAPPRQGDPAGAAQVGLHPYGARLERPAFLRGVPGHVPEERLGGLVEPLTVVDVDLGNDDRLRRLAETDVDELRSAVGSGRLGEVTGVMGGAVGVVRPRDVRRLVVGGVEHEGGQVVVGAPLGLAPVDEEPEQLAVHPRKRAAGQHAEPGRDGLAGQRQCDVEHVGIDDQLAGVGEAAGDLLVQHGERPRQDVLLQRRAGVGRRPRPAVPVGEDAAGSRGEPEHVGHRVDEQRLTGGHPYLVDDGAVLADGDALRPVGTERRQGAQGRQILGGRTRAAATGSSSASRSRPAQNSSVSGTLAGKSMK